MSYKEKQKIELVIEILSKISIFLYMLVAVELFAYVIDFKVACINVRSIAIEKYAVIVVATAALGYIFYKISAKVKEEFIKKLKYTK